VATAHRNPAKAEALAAKTDAVLDDPPGVLLDVMHERQARVIGAAPALMRYLGNNGVGNFAAHLAEGDTSGLSLPVAFPGDTVGLVDARKAQILVGVRSHGQPIPGMVKEQTSMYNGGGCHDLESDPPAFDPTDACEDVQGTTVFVP